jgi:hypothetical protein
MEIPDMHSRWCHQSMPDLCYVCTSVFALVVVVSLQYVYTVELNINGLELMIRDGTTDTRLGTERVYQLFEAIRNNAPSTWPNNNEEMKKYTHRFGSLHTLGSHPSVFLVVSCCVSFVVCTVQNR